MDLVREKGEHNAVSYSFWVDTDLESTRACLQECSQYFAQLYAQQGSRDLLDKVNRCAVCSRNLQSFLTFLSGTGEDERIRVMKGEG